MSKKKKEKKKKKKVKGMREERIERVEEKEVGGEFYEKLKALDFWDEDSGDDERLQKTVKTLRGEIRRDWTREDFMISNAD